MYIMNGNRTAIINSDHVQRITIDWKDDAVLLVASLTNDRPVTVARYQTEQEAVNALMELHEAIDSGQEAYCIHASTGVNTPQDGRPRNGHHGAKHKGHGGS